MRLAGLLDQFEQARKIQWLKWLASSIAKVHSQEELAGKVFDVLNKVVGNCTSWIRFVNRRGEDSNPEFARLAVSDCTWERRTPRFRQLTRKLWEPSP
jgi:hypothetical protein